MPLSGLPTTLQSLQEVFQQAQAAKQQSSAFAPYISSKTAPMNLGQIQAFLTGQASAFSPAPPVPQKTPQQLQAEAASKFFEEMVTKQKAAQKAAQEQAAAEAAAKQAEESKASQAAQEQAIKEKILQSSKTISTAQLAQFLDEQKNAVVPKAVNEIPAKPSPKSTTSSFEDYLSQLKNKQAEAEQKAAQTFSSKPSFSSSVFGLLNSPKTDTSDEQPTAQGILFGPGYTSFGSEFELPGFQEKMKTLFGKSF